MLPAGLKEDLVNALRGVFGTGVSAIVLYGSAARGEQTPESDIDIALFLRDPMSREEREEMLSRLVELDWKYSLEVSVCDIQQSRFTEWADILPFYRNIREEGIALWTAA